MISRRIQKPQALGVLLCLLAPAWVWGTPLSAPVDLGEKLLDRRTAEAAAKTRALSVLQGAPPALTPNQAQYDVHYYDLDLDFAAAPSIYQLTAQVGVLAEVTGDSIATMDLDLDDNLWVTGVTAGGAPVAYTHAQDVLTVSLDRSYLQGESVLVTVDYAGNPQGDAFGWDEHNGEDMIWTLSEPYGARTWWPCKDVNSDKADSLDIRITVASNLIAVSQGVLLSNLNHGTTRTFHWRTDYPTNTYQVSVAIHPYTFFSDTYIPQGGGAPMEVQFYVFPDHYDDVQATYAKTVDMIDAFAQSFGEYPFLDEKYGHAEFLGGAGMEHQTISSMGTWDEDVIAHELAHQWFGDHVTCADFGHVWLNEGFATWCEAYWHELSEGPEAYRTYMEAASFYNGGTIFVEDPNDFSSIFSATLTYNKASWVVHMLRGILGDADFFAGLQAYQAQYAYSSATTEQFRDVMESVSGKDLDAFFDQWIYGEYYPCYAKEWHQLYGPDAGTLVLTVDQVQTNTGLFTMPLRVRVETSADTLDFTVDNSLASQTYYFNVTGDVQNVELDPDHWILRRIQDPVESPSFSDGVLVVNGVNWVYASELVPAYEDSAFSGQQDFDFWDVFEEPQEGYPAELPAPTGHGYVPAEVLGRYSTVVWVSDSYKGDVIKWFDTSIYPYLQAGGNVLLITRRARSFFDEDLTDYLGVTWTNNATTLQDYTADYPGLTDIDFHGSQSWNDLFSLSVAPQSTVLYRDTSYDRGVGVHAQALGGGSVRPTGGHFALLSGRPYRLDPAELRPNVDVLLGDLFHEQHTVSAPEPHPEAGVRLLPSYPNPFAAQTVIPFSLEHPSPVRLAVYDVAGRRVRTLLEGTLPAGPQQATWNGLDGQGQSVASGIYYVRLDAAGETSVRTVVRTH